MSETLENPEKFPSRGEARRRAMLDAAWNILLEKGFSGVTLNEVISRSGGSRTTLYEAFGGKDGLIAAVLTEKCQEFSAELDISLETTSPPREALINFATLLTHKILSDEAVRITHILQAEAHHFPNIFETFTKQGPQHTTTRLTEYLKRQCDRGLLRIEDPLVAARALLAMIDAQWRQSLLDISPRQPTSDDEITLRSRQVIDLFMNGAAPDQTPAK